MRRLRIDVRLLVAASLALVAGLGVLAITRPPDRVAVLVASEPLPAGVGLDNLPLREVETEPVPGLLLAADLIDLEGWTLRVAVPEGDAVTRAMLAPPDGNSPDLLGLTLERDHAVQGALMPGHHVDIYVTDDAGTRLLADGVVITSVELGAGGLGGSEVALVVAVDEDLAERLIAATHVAELDLVLVDS